ncbi:uncharacterized protein C1orf105 homolog [Erinaceus europaeus]|uniref:Uncharacterized protein C1orf105 homolog n=1 Tax=Erinaceus europaeus TaxID=9365 RepID=A0ABM3XYH5_ERIEU|nr:uncharacterized protein C1orf105 homolog [Erinaceus europaeus]
MEKKELKVPVPKFDNIPWLSSTSLSNKPLVLSIPKRSQPLASLLVSPKKDLNSPISFQVPEVSSQAWRNRSGPRLSRNKHLCDTCRQIIMAQPTLLNPDSKKLTFKNVMNQAVINPALQDSHPEVCPPRDNTTTESTHCRLPIMGPRIAVFHGLLSDAYRSLQASQASPKPRKASQDKVKRQ